VRRIDELERRISELQLELKQCEGQQGRTGSVQTGYSGRPAQPVRSDRPNWSERALWPVRTIWPTCTCWL